MDARFLHEDSDDSGPADCADASADLNVRYAHMAKSAFFLTSRLILMCNFYQNPLPKNALPRK